MTDTDSWLLGYTKASKQLNPVFTSHNNVDIFDMSTLRLCFYSPWPLTLSGCFFHRWKQILFDNPLQGVMMCFGCGSLNCIHDITPVVKPNGPFLANFVWGKVNTDEKSYIDGPSYLAGKNYIKFDAFNFELCGRLEGRPCHNCFQVITRVNMSKFTEVELHVKATHTFTWAPQANTLIETIPLKWIENVLL